MGTTCQKMAPMKNHNELCTASFSMSQTQLFLSDIYNYYLEIGLPVLLLLSFPFQYYCSCLSLFLLLKTGTGFGGAGSLILFAALFYILSSCLGLFSLLSFVAGWGILGTNYRINERIKISKRHENFLSKIDLKIMLLFT